MKIENLTKASNLCKKLARVKELQKLTQGFSNDSVVITFDTVHSTTGRRTELFQVKGVDAYELFNKELKDQELVLRSELEALGVLVG